MRQYIFTALALSAIASGAIAAWVEPATPNAAASAVATPAAPAEEEGRPYSLWDDVAAASGIYRGVIFNLSNGVADVTAPAGRYWSVEAKSYKEAESVRWHLETIPEWCFNGDGMEGFLLYARRLCADGKPGAGALARESTLLLFWRDTTVEVYGGWTCAMGHLGVGLAPLRCANAVEVRGDRLVLRTAWRADPVAYAFEIDRSRNTLIPVVLDRAASIIFDLGFQFRITERDADVEGRNREFIRELGSNLVCRAVWRSPDAEDAYFDWVEKHRVARADAYDSVPELADGGGFTLPRQDSIALARLYDRRGDYEKYDIDYDDEAVALLDQWRKAAEPALLTVRLTDAKAGESADFSVSRDGGWLLIESGYRMPAYDDQDGYEHRRITAGACLYRIPDKHRPAARQAIDRARNAEQGF